MGTRYNTKLDPERAEAIRREYDAAQGRVTYHDIAVRMGVSESTVARIVKGHTYRGGIRPPTHRMPTAEEQQAMFARLMRVQEEVDTYGAQPVAGIAPHVRQPAGKTFNEVWEEHQKALDNPAPTGDTTHIGPTTGDE